MADHSDHPYAAAGYAEALAGEPGRVIEAPEWGSRLLSRALPDGCGAPGLRDAAGVYPMTPIAADADLAGGLRRLSGEGLVSLVFVPDPLASPPPDRLRSAFGFCRPFKTHYLIDRSTAPYAPSKHHRDRIRRGHRRCRVETSPLAERLEAWTALYAGLVERRAITGAAAFGPAYFAALAREPRIVAFAAFVGEALGGMTLWFAYEGVAYNHLTAANALGYANGASYALYDAAIAHFSATGAIINLGGCAGPRDDPEDGLAAFKRGFANSAMQAHLCGAVLDPARYAALSAGRAGDGYFPAYRQ